MGKLIEFPTGKVLNDDGVNAGFEQDKQAYLKLLNDQFQKTYSEGFNLINNLLLGLNKKYINENQMNDIFESLIVELLKLYLANENYDINRITEILKNF